MPYKKLSDPKIGVKMRKSRQKSAHGHPIEVDGDPLLRKDLFLNEFERDTLKRRHLASQAIKMLVNKDKPFLQIAEELKILPADLVAELFASDEYRIVLFDVLTDKILDFDQKMSRKAIAASTGISLQQLRKIIDSDEFRAAYSRKFSEVRGDPIIRAIQQSIVEDVLPDAFALLKDELSPNAPWAVRQKARQDVFKLAGIEATKPQANDKEEAVKFLETRGVTINQITVNVPQEYKDKLEDDIVDGELS